MNVIETDLLQMSADDFIIAFIFALQFTWVLLSLLVDSSNGSGRLECSSSKPKQLYYCVLVLEH